MPSSSRHFNTRRHLSITHKQKHINISSLFTRQNQPHSFKLSSIYFKKNSSLINFTHCNYSTESNKRSISPSKRQERIQLISQSHKTQMRNCWPTNAVLRLETVVRSYVKKEISFSWGAPHTSIKKEKNSYFIKSSMIVWNSTSARKQLPASSKKLSLWLQQSHTSKLPSLCPPRQIPHFHPTILPWRCLFTHNWQTPITSASPSDSSSIKLQQNRLLFNLKSPLTLQISPPSPSASTSTGRTHLQMPWKPS